MGAVEKHFDNGIKWHSELFLLWSQCFRTCAAHGPKLLTNILNESAVIINKKKFKTLRQKY